MQAFILSALDSSFRLSFILVVLYGCAVLARDNKYLYRVFVTLASMTLLAFLILLVVLIAIGLIYLAFGV